MQSAAQILQAVNAFREAMLGDREAQNGLRQLAESFGADAITMETRERSSGNMLSFGEWNIDPDSSVAYEDHYGAISPRVAYGIRAKPEMIVHDTMIAPMGELERSEFYGEFLSAFNLKYFLSITVDPVPDIFSVIALQFRPSHGAVDSEQLVAAGAVRPFLARAALDGWRRGCGSDPSFIMRDLAMRFGLTPSEARLAMGMLQGKSVTGYARDTGISSNTAYTHYARLKHKLACEKQGQLVRRLSALYPAIGE